MRFTAVLLGALATLAVAQSSSSSSGTATTAVQNTQTAADPAQSSAYEKVLKCIAACNPGDVNCQAKCSGVCCASSSPLFFLCAPPPIARKLTCCV